ncbi:MAG: hypothetical protein NT015_03550 [Alphaproteobacteria bacterium]|nr:hypothetical protein [Alphaproteobacteria bacterium]
MRVGLVGLLLLALAGCVTAPLSPEEQAAYWGEPGAPPTESELAGAAYLQNYYWVSLPDTNDYVMIYPRNAWDAEAQGRVQLNCIVQPGGKIACRARDDGQPRYDFERAATMISTRFRLTARGQDLDSIVGYRVDVGVQFRLY